MNMGRVPDADKMRSDSGFRMVYELGFDEMIPFVFSQIRKKGIMSWLYFASVAGLMVFVAFQVIEALSGNVLSGRQVIWQSIAGIFSGSFLVIPVHELIHGMAYRMLGARKIIFGADLQQFIFYVTADRYPVSGKSIVFLAMLPFVLINLATFLVVFMLFPSHTVFAGVLLLSHNIMCIGDFAISNYVVRSPRALYSFDIPEEKKSYFYEKV